MKKNTSWKFTDESSITFQSSVNGPGEFGQRLESIFFDGAAPARDLQSEEIVTLNTEIMTRKVVLWYFFISEMSEKSHNSTFRVKISRTRYI